MKWELSGKVRADAHDGTVSGQRRVNVPTVKCSWRYNSTSIIFPLSLLDTATSSVCLTERARFLTRAFPNLMRSKVSFTKFLRPQQPGNKPTGEGFLRPHATVFALCFSLQKLFKMQY